MRCSTAWKAYEALAVQRAARLRRWSAYVHQTPDEAELAAIRRSNETGLPLGARAGSNGSASGWTST